MQQKKILSVSFLKNIRLFFFFCSSIFLTIEPGSVSYGIDLEKGQEIFTKNCIVCHIGGNNLIIPEKNLKKDALEENGMNTITAISYQVLNGKNGMPAFGGRLSEKEIEEVAKYILETSSVTSVAYKNFE
jgi:cytochrome c6